MKLNTDSFVGVGICILGLLGVGYAVGVHSRMKAVCDKLDTSIDRLANETEVDIPAKVIDQAVQRAVDRESYSAVKRATDEVVDDVKREIEARVGAAVKEHYDAISDGFRIEPPGYPKTVSTPCSFRHSMTISDPFNFFICLSFLFPVLFAFWNLQHSPPVPACHHGRIAGQIAGGHLRLPWLPFCPSSFQLLIGYKHIQGVIVNVDGDPVSLFYQGNGASHSRGGNYDEL